MIGEGPVGESVVGGLVEHLSVGQWLVVGGRWIGGVLVGGSAVDGIVEDLILVGCLWSLTCR